MGSPYPTYADNPAAKPAAGEADRKPSDEQATDPASVPILPPTTHYELLRLLGRGGYSEVYEAWDTRLQRKVAIKRLMPAQDLTADECLREARLSARVRHPAFVTIHDVVELDGRIHIVMELVSGQTLAALIAEGAMPIERAIDLMVSAADALAAAHASQVVHGDIKPANLMVDDGHRLRILDFGIARSISDRLSTREHSADDPVAGTLAYMAPEQMLGAPSSVLTDIYALGLVFHEMLSGERFYADQPALALAHRKLHEEATPRQLPDVNRPMAELLQAMAQRRPDQRPASMAEVLQTLQEAQLKPLAQTATLQAASSAPATEAPSTASAPAGVATPSRSPSRKALSAVALLLGAALLAWAFIHPFGGASSANVGQATALLMAFDDEGHLDRATSLLEAFLEDHPGNPTAAATLSIAYCLKYAGDASDKSWLKRAAVSAELALRGEDQLSLAHAARAWVLELQGDFGPAEAAYARALALDPQSFHGLNGYASLLAKTQRREQAQEVLTRALLIYPKNPVFLNALGALRYQAADYRGAEAAFRQSIAAKPTGVLAYANLNAALTRQNRPDEALAVLQQGLQLRPDGRLYSNLGTTLFGQGRYVEAADAFERALSNSKGSPNDYLKWANLADTLRWIPGRQAQAQSAYRHALQMLEPLLDHSTDSTRLSRAALYAAKLGEAQRSRQLWSLALAQAPAVADVLFRATVSAELTGDRDTALAFLRRALAAGYPVHTVEEEPDLQPLRRDLRYHQLQTGEHP